MRLTRAFGAALAAAFFAAGCGGGGGGGGNGGDPPIADAGDDAAARLHQAHVLDGSQSVDPEGKELTFAWSTISAPDGSAVSLASVGSASNVSFTPDREGTYVFGLVVSDGKKLSALDTVEVEVELRIAVFADREGDVARELELAGAGQIDDFYGWPDSSIAASDGDNVIIFDTRLRTDTLIVYRAGEGTQEQIVSGIDIENIRVAGDHVVWSEYRGGQYDLFTRNLVTGAELQITNDEAVESVGGISPEFLAFSKDNPPYGVDAFFYEFASGGITNVSDTDLGVDDYASGINADHVLVQSYEATPAVYAYDMGLQTSAPVATATTATQFSYGLAGDFAIVSISTGGNYTLYTIDLTNGDRNPVTPTSNYLVDIDADGDTFLFRDGSGLGAHRISTGTTVVVSPNANSGSIDAGVIVWPESNGLTNDVATRTFPAGAVTTIPGSSDAYDVAALPSGIAWASHPGSWVFDVFYSGDGGTTVDLASDGKVFLTDRVADYDVAIVGGDGGTSFGDETIEALSAAGVPILSLDREGDSVLDYYIRESLHGFDEISEECNEAAIRFNNSTHPSFAGFPAGGYVVLDREDINMSYLADGILVDDMAPPADYFPIATYDVASDCNYDGEAAIALFTDANGTAVIIDAAGRDTLALWTTERRELILSELRYLASTRAP